MQGAEMSSDMPYKGLNVIDLSQGVAGPYCGMLLACQGANVIKVEPPEGDWSRRLMPSYGDNTAFSILANIGKRGLALDLKTKKGRKIIEQLVSHADIFIQGFRPGVIDRLGFSFERVSHINPSMIYVSVSGFGLKGPLRAKPAMDPILQAFTGFMSENHGPDGKPHRTPNIINDMATGLYAMQAVGAALYARRDTGKGRHIPISLMEASASIQAVRLMSNYRDGPFKVSMMPNGVYQTSDGWIQITVIWDRDFRQLCHAFNWPEGANNPDFAEAEARLANADALDVIIGEIIEKDTSNNWCQRLNEAGIQNEVVQTYSQFVEHPHVKESGLIAWVPQSGSRDSWAVPNVPGVAPFKPYAPGGAAPSIGQHSAEILEELGYSPGDILKMSTLEVIKVQGSSNKLTK
tara:strand:- start:689 stop:1906 length:1218 start_codon:yes stop_codon:yes gene_type:complete